MPRRLTPFVPECYYHIYNRGNNRGPIFFQQENYIYFLQGLKRYFLPVADIIAYCLMPTHYHLMIRVKQASQTSGVFKTPEVCEAAPACCFKGPFSQSLFLNLGICSTFVAIYMPTP